MHRRHMHGMSRHGIRHALPCTWHMHAKAYDVYVTCHVPWHMACHMAHCMSHGMPYPMGHVACHIARGMSHGMPYPMARGMSHGTWHVT